jgi:hypothetical protein
MSHDGQSEMDVSTHPVDDAENSILTDSRSSAHKEVPQEHIASPNPSFELSNVDSDKALAGYDARTTLVRMCLPKLLPPPICLKPRL